MTKAMVVAGVMSGTSADGVDVALCRIGPGPGKDDPPRVKLIGHLGTAYPKAVRAAVLRVMEGEALPAAEVSRLNWRLGGIYADCVDRAAKKFGLRVGLVGCHGQTVHHEAGGTPYLGRRVRSTWQMGESAVIAERLRCPVVSDFRPADLAASGQGAPLVPMLDWCLFRSKTNRRVLLNLGGIANLTMIPAGGKLSDVVAFDTGPGNMIIDAMMQREFGRPFDRGGKVGLQGLWNLEVVRALMEDQYFRRRPPKSCGREEFGAAYADRLIEMCKAAGGSAADAVATATELTARSVVDAYYQYGRMFKPPLLTDDAEVIAAGGGVKNEMLMQRLKVLFLMRAETRMRTMESVGVEPQAKEGLAFALLAWLTWNGLPGNVPAATGAKRAVVLGKVSFG
jgi:anhydro-N-acetylmuramic acid kinase